MEETINLQTMTDDAIADLATRCLDCLDLASKVQAVLKAFHTTEDREELANWLEEDDAEAEGEDEE